MKWECGIPGPVSETNQTTYTSRSFTIVRAFVYGSRMMKGRSETNLQAWLIGASTLRRAVTYVTKDISPMLCKYKGNSYVTALALQCGVMLAIPRTAPQVAARAHLCIPALAFACCDLDLAYLLCRIVSGCMQLS